MADTIPLSYMIRESQFQVAQGIGQWFRGFVNAPGTDPPGEMARGIQSYTDPDSPYNEPWSPEHQVFQDKGGRWLRVTFEHRGWDPSRSEWVYGPEHVTKSELEVLENHSYLFDNRKGVEALDIDLEEDVTYEHSRSTSTSHTLQLDFGAKEKGTIGGEKSGVSLELEVSEALGITDQDTDAKSESTSVTRKQAVRTKVPAGTAVLATISAPTVTASRAFSIDGVWLADMRLGFWGGDGPGGAYPGGYEAWAYIKNLAASQGRTTRGIAIPLSDDTLTEIHFTSMDDFLEALYGHNVYFPKVEDLPQPRLVFFGIDEIIDGRRIQWAGTELTTEQNAADYEFAAVTNVDAALRSVREDHVVVGAEGLRALMERRGA